MASVAAGFEPPDEKLAASAAEEIENPATEAASVTQSTRAPCVHVFHAKRLTSRLLFIELVALPIASRPRVSENDLNASQARYRRRARAFTAKTQLERGPMRGS
jgi:hypothetical protein